MKLKSIHFLFFLSILFFGVGCSKDNDDIRTNEKAPSSPSGKEFTFYPTPDRWSFRVLVGKSPDQAAIRVNSDSWSINKPFSYYSKTSENSATLSVNFNAYTTLGTGPVGQYHEYELKLTFTSEHQGTYIGVHKQGAIGNLQSENISGYFVFDSDELPNTNDDGSEVDYSFLIGTWNAMNVGYSMKFTFNSDKTYSQKMIKSSESIELKGTYRIDDANNILYLTESGGDFSSNYHILNLTDNKLEMQQYNQATGIYGLSVTYTKEVSSSEINISKCTISEITSSSVTISGSIQGSNGTVFKEKGICLSRNSIPNTTNSTIVKINNDVIDNLKISELLENTTYYVCLYAITDKKTYYGEAVSITTKKGGSGVTISDIMKAEVVSVTSNSIAVYGAYASLATSAISVGFCASTKPNPTITDINIPEQMNPNPWQNSVRVISGLKSNTTYYVRPYSVAGKNITYYGETSAKTTGVDINIAMSRPVSIGSNLYEFTITYNIKTPGQYRLQSYFWSLSGIYKFDLGYVKEGSGTAKCTFPKEIWSKIEYYGASLIDIATEIYYESPQYPGGVIR